MHAISNPTNLHLTHNSSQLKDSLKHATYDRKMVQTIIIHNLYWDNEKSYGFE